MFHQENAFSSNNPQNFRSLNIASHTQENGFYKNGVFELKWQDLGDSTFFEFSTSLSVADNFWTAFAFSNDQFMVKIH
jgi:hypothetical protein